MIGSFGGLQQGPGLQASIPKKQVYFQGILLVNPETYHVNEAVSDGPTSEHDVQQSPPDRVSSPQTATTQNGKSLNFSSSQLWLWSPVVLHHLVLIGTAADEILFKSGKAAHLLHPVFVLLAAVTVAKASIHFSITNYRNTLPPGTTTYALLQVSTVQLCNVESECDPEHCHSMDLARLRLFPNHGLYMRLRSFTDITTWFTTFAICPWLVFGSESWLDIPADWTTSPPKMDCKCR